MPDYRIFFLEGGRIKEPAKIISCADDDAATEEARKLLLNGAHQSLEVARRSPRCRHGAIQKMKQRTRTIRPTPRFSFS
jgi:hypothetical protein